MDKRSRSDLSAAGVFLLSDLDGIRIMVSLTFPTDQHPHCYLHAVQRIGIFDGNFQKLFWWRT